MHPLESMLVILKGGPIDGKRLRLRPYELTYREQLDGHMLIYAGLVEKDEASGGKIFRYCPMDHEEVTFIDA